MVGLVEKNPNHRPLPWIDQDSDTYPDMDKVRGEQTYLAAVIYQALVQLGWIFSVLDGLSTGEPFFDLADRIKTQVNLPLGEGGLWDDAAGCYVGWRDPQGKLEPAGGHETFSNLLAIARGLSDDRERHQTILRFLDDHWDAIYTPNATPMTHADVAYWQSPDGARHGIPWIVGWDLQVRFGLNSPRRFDVWNLYRKGFYATDYAYLECAWPWQTYESLEREHSNRGRVWDSWGFMHSVWGIQFGLEPDLGHLRLQPAPLEPDGKPALACFIWQSHSYELLVSGSGECVNSLRVNGEDWPSTLLPRRNAKVEVDLGEKPLIPWLDRADPLISIHEIAFDPAAVALSIELSSVLKAKQHIGFALPDGWSIQSVQANGNDMVVAQGSTGLDMSFETGRESLLVRFVH